MRSFLVGIIGAISLLGGSSATADVLGAADDTYAGLQVTIPLNKNRAGLFSRKSEINAVLINQADGNRDGLVFTRDMNGKRTIGYLRPSQTYQVGRGRISDYTMPLISFDENAASQTDYAGEMIFGLIVGVAVVVKMLDFAADEFGDCLDPDTDAEEIAGC